MTNQSKKVKVFDGNYEILSIVGRGECSVVYQARHITAPYDEVALKVLVSKSAREVTLEKLRKEALAMVSARHQYVIRLDDFHSYNGLCYICMEYAPEHDLRVYAKKFGGKLPIEQAEVFFNQILEALSFVHESGIIHRDIKPDNILVIDDSQVRLADFGISTLPGEESTIEDLKKGVGTMDYMAPEVVEGHTCDQRADVYALGITFYEMLSGIQPFAGVPLANILSAREDHNIKPLSDLVPDIPNYMSKVIMQAMRYDLTDRFSSAGEMLSTFLAMKFKASAPLIDQSSTSKHEDPSAALFRDDTVSDKNISQDSFNDQASYDDLNNDYDDSNDFQQNSAEDEVGGTLSSEEVSFNTETSYHDNKNLKKSDDSLNPEEIEDEIDSSGYNFYRGKRQSKATLAAIKNKERYEDSFKTTSSQRNFTLPILIIAAIILIAVLALGIIGIGSAFNDSNKVGSNEDISFHVGRVVLLPTVEDDLSDSSFEHLQAGTYVGSIKNLFKDSDTPLTLISNPKSGVITVIIGIGGWEPVQIKIPQDKAGLKLNINANGFYLSLKANDSGDAKSISGTFDNIITGEKGTWKVAAVRK